MLVKLLEICLSQGEVCVIREGQNAHEKVGPEDLMHALESFPCCGKALSDERAIKLYFSSNETGVNRNLRSSALSVRCIKN